MLIASSGDAETNSVKAATDAWAKQTGNTVDVKVASDMDQELAQGFAGGSPADIMYMDAGKFATFAKQGSLEAYTDKIPDNDKFYETLRKTFTYDGKQYCVPKDFSALALQINTDMWTKAGLTDADIPTTWDQLTEVSKKLTTDKVAGLGIGVGIDRLGAFVVQNRRLVAQCRQHRRHRRRRQGRRRPEVRPGQHQGRQLQDVQRPRRRLGRRGLR